MCGFFQVCSLLRLVCHARLWCTLQKELGTCLNLIKIIDLTLAMC